MSDAKKFKVTDKFVEFGIGQRLVLRPDQVESRAHALSFIKGNIFEVTKNVQFKTGEVFGIVGEIDKGFLAHVSEATAADEKAAVEKIESEKAAEKERLGKAKQPAEPKKPAAGNKKDPLSLEDAIKALNPSDDSHWTEGGKPDLNVLKEYTGKKVSRGDVEAIVGKDYNRSRFESLTGSGVQPSEFKLADGTVLSLGDVVRRAFEASDMTVQEWNAADDDEREAAIQDAVDELDLADDGDGQGSEGDDGTDAEKGGKPLILGDQDKE